MTTITLSALLPVLLLALFSGDAVAQEDRTLERAGEIVTQPVRDIGIGGKAIAPVLARAAEAPYAPPLSHWCAPLLAEMVELNAALGPDLDADPGPKRNPAGKLADAGGQMLVNSLIPFRDLVREVSGAASAERRRQAALAAGAARRSYLRGLAEAQGCSAAQ